MGTDRPSDHSALAIEAADNAEQVLPIFERLHPMDDRPRAAVEAARAWARGEIRVGEARSAAFAAHAAARSADDPAASAAARAAGHAAATAHVPAHSNHCLTYAEKALALASATR